MLLVREGLDVLAQRYSFPICGMRAHKGLADLPPSFLRIVSITIF
jgi:hypothetical protein